MSRNLTMAINDRIRDGRPSLREAQVPIISTPGTTPEAFKPMPEALKDSPAAGKDAYRKLMELGKKQADYVRTTGAGAPAKALDFERRCIELVKDLCKPLIQGSNIFDEISQKVADDIEEGIEGIAKEAALHAQRITDMTQALHGASVKPAQGDTGEDKGTEKTETDGS